MMISVYLLAVVLSIVALVSTCSCTRTIYTPVESTIYHTDTLRLTNVRMDSIVQHDSVAVYVHGDTVRITQYRDRLRYRDRVDTIYRTKVDTARIEKPIIVTTEAEMTKSETLRLKSWGWLLALLIISLAWIFRKHIKSFLNQRLHF